MVRRLTARWRRSSVPDFRRFPSFFGVVSGQASKPGRQRFVVVAFGRLLVPVPPRLAVAPIATIGPSTEPIVGDDRLRRPLDLHLDVHVVRTGFADNGGSGRRGKTERRKRRSQAWRRLRDVKGRGVKARRRLWRQTDSRQQNPRRCNEARCARGSKQTGTRKDAWAGKQASLCETWREPEWWQARRWTRNRNVCRIRQTNGWDKTLSYGFPNV